MEACWCDVAHAPEQPLQWLTNCCYRRGLWRSALTPSPLSLPCRLVTDRDTGKPKGYGFCEFYDLPTSQSAQRNLNGHEVGGRALRVDFADDSTKPMPRSSAGDARPRFLSARIMPVRPRSAPRTGDCTTTVTLWPSTACHSHHIGRCLSLNRQRLMSAALLVVLMK